MTYTWPAQNEFWRRGPNKAKKVINEKADAANVIIRKYLLHLLLFLMHYCTFQLKIAWRVKHIDLFDVLFIDDVFN